MADIIQIRRDTAANWSSANPTLANGEQGYETDTGKMKIGDGSTAWTSLEYFAGSGGSSTWTGLTDTPSSITPLHIVRGNSSGTALETISQSTLLLDNFGTPEDNTDLNATTGHHGLLPKLGGGTTNYLRADGVWAEPSGSGSGLPVVDTTSIVTGSSDATKQMRFEVDGLTTNTTRVLTVQDKDITICDDADLAAHTNAANPHSGSAASGANSDITSLSGLTTPLSVAQGGTGVSDDSYDADKVDGCHAGIATGNVYKIPTLSGHGGECVKVNTGGTALELGACGTGGGVTDHGALTGLGDDDHSQYLLVNGSRAMSGRLKMGNNVLEDITRVAIHADADGLEIRDASDTTTTVVLGSSTYGIVVNYKPVHMGGQKIVSLADPTDSQDAATKAWCEANLGSGGDACYVIAANDTPETIKNRADVICDGVSDETEINTALATYHAVTLTEGTFVIDGTINIGSNQSLVGAGASTIVKIANIDSDLNMITCASDATYIDIERITFDGNNTENTTGAQNGIRLNATQHFIIDKCAFVHFGRADTASCMGIHDSSAMSQYGVISNNSFYDVVDGINLVYGSKYILISNNKIYSTNRDYGMNLAISDSVVSNNVIKDCTNHGIRFNTYFGDSKRNIIAGNIIENCNTGNDSKDGICLVGSCEDILIHHNIIRKGTYQRYGISLDVDLVSNSPNNIRIYDNDLRTSGVTGAIYVHSDATNIEISSNKGYNPVGGSSISVGSSPFTYTAGSSPETVYIRSGTVSSIVIGGRTLFTDTGHSIDLPPHTEVVVTYSSTPTMEKYVH